MAETLRQQRLTVDTCKVSPSMRSADPARGAMPENVRLEKRGPVAHLVLDRPEKHNALRFDDLDTLVDLLHAAEEYGDVAVVLLRGEGPSFCAAHGSDDAVRSYGLEPGPAGQATRRRSQR